MESKKKIQKCKIVVVLGESGSGKDALAKELFKLLKENGYPVHKTIQYTTRPKRDYEVDGVDYHFSHPGVMVNLIYSDQMLEVVDFNEWVYGTCIQDLEPDKINIEVLNPAGTEAMSMDERVDLFIVQCVCSEKERLIRQLTREQQPNIDEIIRRLQTDRQDFIGFQPQECTNNFFIISTEGDFSIEEEAHQVLAHMRAWTAFDN